MTFRKPSFKVSVVEGHYAFLSQLRANGILELAGPFTDKSGGAYIIKAENFVQAKKIAFEDPLHLTDSSEVTVYEWKAE